jgi:hypothetical protein
MITLSLLLILSIAYIVLKVINTRAEFARRDAEREANEKARMEAIEEEAEVEEIRLEAIDVDDVEVVPAGAAERD